MADPRPQPYIFAHLALPALFFRTPESMLQNFSDQGPEFLQYLWRQIGLKEGQHDELAGMQIRVTVHKSETFTIGLIAFPPAAVATEAYYAAAVWSPEAARYFTLELGENLDGTTRTVFCEWTSNGRHYNYGDGPPAEDSGSFLELVKLRLSPQA
ncbi:MAG: hypothetical protein EPO32_00460 [Anaerolineae bacterium]|nr:MAG: hypothetical protein EPO32_00460 [Anaerolineae bacterium]